MGARSPYPFNGGGDWICTKPDHWIFDGTGMKNGDAHSGPGRLGVSRRSRRRFPASKSSREGIALNGGTRPVHWTATIYPGPKGNFVFNASTIFWAQGLSSPPGPHAAVVALDPPARSRRTGSADHSEPSPPCSKVSEHLPGSHAG